MTDRLATQAEIIREQQRAFNQSLSIMDVKLEWARRALRVEVGDATAAPGDWALAPSGGAVWRLERPGDLWLIYTVPAEEHPRRLLVRSKVGDREHIAVFDYSLEAMDAALKILKQEGPLRT